MISMMHWVLDIYPGRISVELACKWPHHLEVQVLDKIDINLNVCECNDVVEV